MDVEALAVSEITRLVARCPLLKPEISTNDKTPFTDGQIHLYRGLQQSNEEWIGRVSVQVKGRTGRVREGTSPSFAIGRTDLLAYQSDSGVLFFVVFIDPETASPAPFYALLSPFAIESILDAASKKRSKVPVVLKQLPQESDGLEGLLGLAWKTREQRISAGFDTVIFERTKTLKLHTAAELTLDAPTRLSPGINDFVLEAVTEEGFSVPLRGEIQIVPQSYVDRHVDLEIRAGTITYDGGTARRINSNTLELRLSAGLTLTVGIPAESQAGNVSLTLEPILAARLKAVEFFVALQETGTVYFGDGASRYERLPGAADEQLRKHLLALRDLAQLLEQLGADLNLVDLTEVTDDEAEQLKVVYRAIVLGEEIVDDAASPSRLYQSVGSWRLMLLLTPGSAPDRWRVLDPFSVEQRHQFLWTAEDGKRDKMPVTAYDVVEDEHLPHVLNLRLEAMVSAYQAIADQPDTFRLANFRVLSLLRAADSSEARRTEFLEAAVTLNEWLIASDGDQPHHLLNRWQIIARRGTLTPEHRREIRALRRRIATEDRPMTQELDLGCALLLGDAEEIEDLIAQLPPEKLEVLQGWPIWRLR